MYEVVEATSTTTETIVPCEPHPLLANAIVHSKSNLNKICRIDVSKWVAGHADLVRQSKDKVDELIHLWRRGRSSDELTEMVGEFYGAGLALQEIGKFLNVSHETIRIILNSSIHKQRFVDQHRTFIESRRIFLQERDKWLFSLNLDEQLLRELVVPDWKKVLQKYMNELSRGAAAKRSLACAQQLGSIEAYARHREEHPEKRLFHPQRVMQLWGDKLPRKTNKRRASDDEIIAATVEFVRDCDAKGIRPTAKEYEKWRKGASGRRFSLTLVTRLANGSWSQSIQRVRDSMNTMNHSTNQELDKNAPIKSQDAP